MEKVILIIILIALCEVCAQSGAHSFSLTGDISYYLLGVMFYSIIVWLLSRAHETWTMGKVNGIWSACSIVMVALTGVLVFGEKISPREWVGLLTIAGGAYIVMSNHEGSPRNEF